MAKFLNPRTPTVPFEQQAQSLPGVTRVDPTNNSSNSNDPLSQILALMEWFKLNGKNYNLPGNLSLDGSQLFGDGFKNLINSGAFNNFDLPTLLGLTGFLNGYHDSDFQSTERNDALFSYLLQLISTNDQRSFDLKQLQDQRNYDSPLSQLARLTGAGIGRDQAIQILQGANGAGVAGSGAGITAPGTSGVSGTMQQQAVANGIAGYQALVGSFAQLLQTGVSIDTAINQNRILAAQAAMSESTLQGYTSADKVVNALQQMELSGSFSPDVVDSWSNADDMYKYFLAHRDDSTIAQLLQSGDFQTAFGSQSGREFINQFWKQRRSSRNDGTLADEYLKQQKFQSAIMSLQPTKIGAELNLIGAQSANTNASTAVHYQSLIESANRIAVGDAQIQVLNKQGHWLDVQGYNQTRLTDSQVNLIDTQAYGQDIENRLLGLNYEYNAAGFPMLKQNRIDEITDEMNYWSTLKTQTARYARMATWLQNVENARDAAYIENLRLQAVGDFAAQNPAIWNLCQGFKASGASDMVRTASGVASSFVPAGKAFKSLNIIK